MQLHNVIIVFDVYALAESSEEARAVILAAIRDAEPLAPSEQVALPVNREREVRESWRGEKPFVAGDVSDADFARVKGKTTLDCFKLLHVKPEPTVVESTPKARKGGA